MAVEDRKDSCRSRVATCDGEARGVRRERTYGGGARARPSSASHLSPHASRVLWRASPHCMVVNLVRSGRKQPQLFSASAGVRLATPIKETRSRIGASQRTLNFTTTASASSVALSVSLRREYPGVRPEYPFRSRRKSVDNSIYGHGSQYLSPNSSPCFPGLSS